MQFQLLQPGQLPEKRARAPYIYASGLIDQTAAARLHALVVAKQIPPSSFVLLDSLGGNLLASIDLGREIRRDGLLTYVHTVTGLPNVGEPAAKPAVCASACTLAFLGGKFRYIDDKSVYAVHRFYFPNQSANAADAAQILSSSIVQYMRDMGIDPQLFTLATGAGRDELIVLTQQQLLALNVVNNGSEKPIWSIEALPEGLYLKGEHKTVWGYSEIAFICQEPKREARSELGRLSLIAIFHAWAADAFLKAKMAGGLILDGHMVAIPVERMVKPSLQQGTVTAVFLLTTQEIQSILHSRTIGAYVQLASNPRTYDGIADFDFSDGRGKIGGFMSSCR